MSEPSGSDDIRSFTISLLVRTPAEQPPDISAVLGLEPNVSWRIGDRKTRLDGSPTSGFRKDTYWAHTRKGNGSPAALVAEWLRELEPFAQFFLDVRAKGGNAAFYVTWSAGIIAGEVFDAELLKRLGEASIDLWLEVVRSLSDSEARWLAKQAGTDPS